MTTEYLIDFLPREFRRRTVLLASRRRSALLLALMVLLVTGVAAHSWTRYRQADIDRAISMQVCANSTKVDDVVDKLAAEQQQISKFLGMYQCVSMPLETSDLVATLTHLMPENMSLAMLRFEIQTEKVTPPEAKQPGAPAKPAAKGKAPAAKETAARPRRWLSGTIRGLAASNNEVFDFERRLNKTKPFDAVTVAENKPTEVPGSQLQSFAINFRIPLDAHYERQAPAPVASAVAAAADDADARATARREHR